jgi:hypothetical protein
MSKYVQIACCSGCGRPLPNDELMLPRIKRRILDIVSRRPGISAERLRELVWADDPAGGPECRHTLFVHIHQLNRLLAPFGIEVRGHVSDGYHVRLHQRLTTGGEHAAVRR